MKNKILWSTLFALISTQIYADLSQPIPSPEKSTDATNSVPSAPTITPTDQNSPPQAPKPVINCDYKIPAETKKIDPSLIKSWTEKAVTQAFDFSPNNLDDQLQKLQPCFTEQGWTGFNTALKKSGNLDAIKSQKLTVSSQVDGQVVVTEAKENEWKIKIPLQVVYQNDKEKVTQLLSVDLTISRKMTGDLGITQMIAAPREALTQENPSTPENNMANPVSNTTPTPNPTGTPATTPIESTPPASDANKTMPSTTTSPNTVTPNQATPPTTNP